jgi:hypothetical protein
LIIKPRGDKLLAAIRGLMNSPTFKQAWIAIASRPADQVDYTMEQRTFGDVVEFAGPLQCNGNPECGRGQTIINGLQGISVVAEEVMSEEAIVDEFLHAVGGFGARNRDIETESGVPAKCGGLECNELRDQIMAEFKAWRQSQSEEGPDIP